MHLIADHIGVFEDKGWDIQKFLCIANNEQSKYITDETVYELTKEDIIGTSTNQQHIQTLLTNIHHTTTSNNHVIEDSNIQDTINNSNNNINNDSKTY